MSIYERKEKMNLSKTLYIRGLQCEKSLWLKKNKSRVLTPTDSQTQSLFDAGHEFGAKACKLFPNGKEIIFKGTTFNQKLSLTKQWIDKGVENTYEATFKYQGILVMVDVLHYTDKVVSLQQSIPMNIERFKKVLFQKNEPKVNMGDHCTNPYSCDAMAYCKHGRQPLTNIFSFFKSLLRK